MGEERHDGLSIPGRVVLAHEPSLSVGDLRVDPPTRQVESATGRETLEPRVMQVLVALVRANGRIVTRDELIAWCWDGRIVGEDAINRAIFRLRQVANDIGGGSFGIETITKVGYRLTGQTASPPAKMQPEPGVDRRTWIAAAAVSAIGAVGAGVAWLKPWRHRPDPEAVELVRLGDLAQRASRPDQTRQAVTYFERAVRLDPQYGAAWGALALSYTHGLDGFGEAQLASFPARIRSAAARALELDPDNADAQLALACIRPIYRNWASMEPELRRIRDRYPEHWLANGRLAVLYYQVGRNLEGAALHRNVIDRDPMIPGPYAFAATALSNAGKIQEADALLKEAADRWPANPLIWVARYNQLLFSGRPASAAALIADPEARPSGMPDEEVAPYLTLARAVERRQPADVDSTIRFLTEMAQSDVRAIGDAAPLFAMLGRPDLAFSSMDRYFLDRGSFGKPSPIGPYTRRFTDFLFWLPMAGARSDRRFHELTSRIGLNAYWAARGMSPPY
jgi:DNA-binding winged helix-turn-helix (wHTH) protein/tetratricopeptide (TPR) repeat protein